MTKDQLQEEACRSLMLGLGRHEAVRRVVRVNAAGTLVEAEDRDGDLYRIEVRVTGIGRKRERVPA